MNIVKNQAYFFHVFSPSFSPFSAAVPPFRFVFGPFEPPIRKKAASENLKQLYLFDMFLSFQRRIRLKNLILPVPLFFKAEMDKQRAPDQRDTVRFRVIRQRRDRVIRVLCQRHAHHRA